MTGFFEQQDRARRTTSLLLTLMALAIVGMSTCVYALLHWFASFRQPAMVSSATLFFGSLVATAGVVLLASVSRVLSLQGGGAQIAEMLGGRLVSGAARDGLETRLLNVVEEMAIASGVPVPQVFVLDGEAGINAFAAGLRFDDATITVTRGSLEKLTRDELQGVIAHEFSHVLNGDMRLNIRMMGLVFGIVCVSLAGRMLIRAGVKPRWDSQGRQYAHVHLLAFGVGVLVIGSIGEFFGKLIKAAVGRQREYLADASAVQFTRNPHGIAGALKKIGGFSEGGRVRIGRAEELSHFFFTDIHRQWLAFPWFATHPPLEQRIARIEPGFTGQFPTVAPGIAQPVETSLPAPAVAALGFAPVQVLQRVGAPSVESVGCARELIAGVPPELRAAADSALSASAIVYALLLSDAPDIAAEQRARIAAIAGPAAGQQVERLAPQVRALRRRARLPLLELLAPALRQLSGAQRTAFSTAVAQLIDADDQVSIFEYVLSHTLADRLADSRRPPRGVRHRAFRSVHAELGLLLSLLAHAGAYDADAAQSAFDQGVSRLFGVQLTLLPHTPRLLSGLSEALDQLRALVPELAQQVVDACAHIVVADQRVSEDELTLLRAVCAALDCPLPPFPGVIESNLSSPLPPSA